MNKGSPKRTKPEAEKPTPEGNSKQKAQSKKHVTTPSKSKGETTKNVPDPSKSPSEIEIPKSEISPTPTATRQSPTIMEVHHHPQLEHNPKPWKEYLLEGFMIFIAVMMGFIAENIRENISNKEHVKHLTAQLVRDLKEDTVQINFGYKGVAEIMKNNDTLFTMLQQPIAKMDIRKLQLLIANAHSVYLVHPSMGAIDAIKNEIHLKQFSNSQMIGFIENYERHIELEHAVQDIIMQYQHLYLDPFIRLHFTPTNLDTAFSDKPVLTAQMRNLTQADLTQLAADLVLFKINLREQLRDCNFIKDDAINMLKYIKQQYSPEE
jgi:hypothetical protein